jgi:hypothetical protein
MRRLMVCLSMAGPLALGACAVAPPSGPTVMALPPQGKSLEAFQQEDGACRGYASQITGGVAPAQAATNSGLASAAVGTALGAAAGALIGSAGGAVGGGAAIGAGAGLLAGSAIGAGNAGATAGALQSQYNTAYTQCMYAKGNSVQSAPAPAYGYGYRAYPYGYPYGYGYGYGYAYPGY